MEELMITKILRKYHLLDDEDYLVSPDSRESMNLVKRLASLREVVESGNVLTPDQELELREIQIAYDYYNDELDEEVVRMTGDYVEHEEECEEEDEYEEELDEEELEEDEIDGESLEDKGISVADLGRIVEEDDSEDDRSYEP